MMSDHEYKSLQSPTITSMAFAHVREVTSFRSWIPPPNHHCTIRRVTMWEARWYIWFLLS